MTRTRGPAVGKVREVGREVGRWIEELARLGLLAKAVVYGLVGILALRLAFGSGGATTGAQGALREIAGAPWGRFLLVAIALGLLGYAAWRIVQGALDVEGAGSDAEGLVKRGGYLGSGVLHASLALYAGALAGGSEGGGGNSEQEWTARLLSEEWGPWLVGLVGLITLGVAIYQFKLGHEARFTRHWRTGEMSPGERRWGTRAGQLGLMARGIVFALIGSFFLRAAWQHDADEVRGLGGALAEVAAADHGTWLLAIVALGLVAYAVYCLVQARYRHFGVSGGASPQRRS